MACLRTCPQTSASPSPGPCSVVAGRAVGPLSGFRTGNARGPPLPARFPQAPPQSRAVRGHAGGARELRARRSGPDLAPTDPDRPRTSPTSAFGSGGGAGQAAGTLGLVESARLCPGGRCPGGRRTGPWSLAGLLLWSLRGFPASLAAGPRCDEFPTPQAASQPLGSPCWTCLERGQWGMGRLFAEGQGTESLSHVVQARK